MWREDGGLLSSAAVVGSPLIVRFCPRGRVPEGHPPEKDVQEQEERAPYEHEAKDGQTEGDVAHETCEADYARAPVRDSADIHGVKPTPSTKPRGTYPALQMTRDEAERMCKRLAAEHPDRQTNQWHPRKQRDGSWGVVKIALPPTDPKELTAETRADEQPDTGDDPRHNVFRNVPPFGAG